MNLQDFIKKYEGVPNIGNTDANKGECVGLVMVWVENLGKSHFWGHAKDLFANAPEDEWDRIENSPSSYPKAGDIMCWGASWGGGYGHTGVVESSSPSTDSFICFEQNYPTGSPPHLVTRKAWNGIIGWLSPKNSDNNGCEQKLEEMGESRNYWKQKAGELKNTLETEREDRAKEVSAKQKIIDDQQILISELNSKAVSDDNTIRTITKERNDWKEAYTKLQGIHDAYVDQKIADDLVLNQKLADSEVKRKKAEKKIQELTFWEFLKIKIGGGN